MSLLMAASIVVLVATFFLEPEPTVYAQDNVEVIKQILANAMPQTSELAQNIKWDKPSEQFDGKEQTDVFANRSWSGKSLFVCYNPTTKKNQHETDGFYISSDLLYRQGDYGYYKSAEEHRNEMLKILGKHGHILYSDLPGAIIQYISKDSGSHSFKQWEAECSIHFYRSPYCIGHIRVRGVVNEPTNVQCQPSFDARVNEIKSYVRPECERLAKLIWSRLPEGKIGAGITPPSTPPGTKPPGTIPPGQMPPSIPPVPPPAKGIIPDSALPIAAGATAAVALLGVWLTTVVQQIPFRETISELTSFLGFGGKSATAELTVEETVEELAAGAPPEEIIEALKERGEPGMDWTPGIGYEKDGYVWSHRPGDLAGDGWVTKEEYESITKMEREGKVWSQRWGWTTLEEAAQLEEQHAKAVKAWNDETSSILKDLTDKEHLKKKLQAEIAEIEQDIDTSSKLAEISLQFADETKQMAEDGYWVRNPYNSKIIDKANMLISPLDEKGVRCQDLVEMKEDHVRQLVKQKFGEGAIVDQVVVDEKSSVYGGGIRDSLDAILEYNHTAIRVITPDGKAYIVDYWQGLHHKGGGTGLIIRHEERWVESWKRDIGPDDFLFQTQGKSSTEGAEDGVALFAQKLGPSKGIEKWQETQIDAINKSNMSPIEKRIKIEEIKTFVNYYNRRGQKIGY